VERLHEFLVAPGAFWRVGKLRLLENKEAIFGANVLSETPGKDALTRAKLLWAALPLVSLNGFSAPDGSHRSSNLARALLVNSSAPDSVSDAMRTVRG
jgi:hypothetical protein